MQYSNHCKTYSGVIFILQVTHIVLSALLFSFASGFIL